MFTERVFNYFESDKNGITKASVKKLKLQLKTSKLRNSQN